MTEQRRPTKTPWTRRARLAGVGVVLLASLLLLSLPPAEGTEPSPLAEALKTHLRAAFPWPEIEVSDISLSEPVTNLAPSRIVIDRNPPGRIAFAAEFPEGKRVAGTAVVKAYDRVVVSARANRKGHVMQEADVYVALMDVTRIPKGGLKDPQELLGKPLSRAVAANMPVVDAMIRERPLVKRGHRVTLLAESASFSITTYGELKSDGLVGGHVKVLNTQSKKIVSGLLLDENTVKVDF